MSASDPSDTVTSDEAAQAMLGDLIEQAVKVDQLVRPSRLVRSSTFVVDEEGDRRVMPPQLSGGEGKSLEEKYDLFSTTLHAGGIRSILERANRQFVFPDEVKSYIGSHFRMIREENDFLRHSLEHKSRQLDDIATAHQDCHKQKKELEQMRQKLKQVESQLERERAKTRAMVRQIKETEPDGGVVWLGSNGSGLNNNDGDENQTAVTTPLDRYESARDKREASGKKGGKTNKTVVVVNLKNEVKRLTDVLNRELGSSSAVEAALQGQGTSWQGRDEQIHRLEDSLNSFQRDSSEHRSSSGENGNRGMEDASKRLKCQVAEVERDRLSEYVRVVTRRLTRSEELTSRAEAELREERRKTARLEHLLEKSQVVASGGLGLSFTSNSQQYQQIRLANASDDVKTLAQELEATKVELEMSRLTREEDWQTYLKMAQENMRMISDSFANGRKGKQDRK